MVAEHYDDGEGEPVALTHIGLCKDDVADTLSAGDGIIILVIVIGIGSDLDLLSPAGSAGDQEIHLVAAIQARVVRRNVTLGIVEKKQTRNTIGHFLIPFSPLSRGQIWRL